MSQFKNNNKNRKTLNSTMRLPEQKSGVSEGSLRIGEEERSGSHMCDACCDVNSQMWRTEQHAAS